MEEELKRQIVNTCKALYELGLISNRSGNVSGRLEGSEHFWITPTRMCKPELTPELLVKLDLQGRIIEGKVSPSREKLMHARIYQTKKEINAVVHAHNPLVLALVASGIPFCPETVEAKLNINPTLVSPKPPGSPELAEVVSNAVQEDYNLVIIPRHGVIAVGQDLLEARAIAETAEMEAKFLLVFTLLKKMRYVDY